MEWFAVWDKRGGPQWLFQFWFYGWRPNVEDNVNQHVVASIHAFGTVPAFVVADEQGRLIHPAFEW